MSVKIHVIDGEEAVHSGVMDFFNVSGYQVVLSTSGKRALKCIKKERPDLVFITLDLPDLSGVEVIKKIKKSGEDITLLPIVSSIEQGIEAMKLGAEYYFVKPYNLEEVKIVLDKCLAMKYYREKVERSRLQYLERLEKSELVAVSKSVREIYQQLIKVAEGRNVPILITGEAGTGKELLAKIIHIRSHQFMFSFVTMNCKDRISKLLDTHLFGVQKGTEKPLLSEGGTLFLYNIEHLARGDQLKLLKFLRNTKCGKAESKDGALIGKRIIAATNVNLKTLVDKGKFNKELCQKISKRSVHIPPLRKRSHEIIPLAMHFIEDFNRVYGKQVVKIAPDVRNYLESYDWPDNVSELRNVIEHAVILSQSENISMKEMEFNVGKKVMTLDSLLLNGSFLSLDEIVNLYVNTVLKKVKGNKSKAAKILKVSRNTLKKKSIAL